MSLYVFISSIIIINTITIFAMVAWLERTKTKKSFLDRYYSHDEIIDDDDDEYEVIGKYSWDK